MLNKNQEKNRRKQMKNKKYKKLIKIQFKKIANYFQTQDTNEEKGKILLTETQSILDRAANKKVIHKNKATRKKSKLHKLFRQEEKTTLNSS